MIYVGIDNGVTTGGIVALSDHPGPPIAMTTFPTQKPRSRTEVDIKALSGWVSDICGLLEGVTFIIEEPNNSRNPSTAYSVASCFHSIRGMLDRCDTKWHRVTPQRWQKAILGKLEKGQTKPAALTKAKQLWPDEKWLATPRSRTPHTGLVDAALIAEYGRIKL